MSDEFPQILPHGALEALGPDLWRVVGSLPMPLPRNKFVHRLAGSGGLLIYSAIALDDAGMAAVEALGRPEVLVVPHPYHQRDAGFYRRRYPDIRVTGPDGVRARAILTDAPDALLTPFGIRATVAASMKMDELVLDLPFGDGLALLFTDLVGQSEGKPSLILKLLGAPSGAGVARIVRWRQLRDRTAVAQFLRRCAQIPKLHLVAGCHGGVVTSDCAAWLERAAKTA